MKNPDFGTKTENLTVIIDAKGNEIERMPGHVEIEGRDYAELLPVECRHITVTTEVVSIKRIDKKPTADEQSSNN